MFKREIRTILDKLGLVKKSKRRKSISDKKENLNSEIKRHLVDKYSHNPNCNQFTSIDAFENSDIRKLSKFVYLMDVIDGFKS